MYIKMPKEFFNYHHLEKNAFGFTVVIIALYVVQMK